MEILYEGEGTFEALSVFLGEHAHADVVVPFLLSDDDIAGLGRTVEVREYDKPVVTLLGGGTTVVTQAKVERQVVLGLPEGDEDVQP